MTKERNIIGNIILYIFLIFMVVVTLVPIAYTVSASFKTNTEIMSGGAHLIPKKFTVENFVTAWTMGSSGGSAIGRKPVTFADYTVNSIILASITVVGTVIFTSMSAYCFQRGDFPGRKLLYNTFLATMFISAGSITIFPVVKLAAKFGMNNLYGASVVQIFTTSAANLFLTMGYMKTIDKEIDNAAKIDGCSFFRTYYNIILPLCKPILATIALLSFRHAWNDYLLPMVFTSGKTSQYPLVVGVVALKSFGGEGAAQYNLLMAGTMFSLVPVITIYLAMNRYFVAGITQGAIKG
jgi:ABC-type glycerol-3-phosphate transport system permease component